MFLQKRKINERLSWKNMNLIAIVGPHGAGKDVVIDQILKKFEILKPGVLKKAIYTVTRPLREYEILGKDIDYATKEDFLKMVEMGDICYVVKVGDYQAGAQIKEFKKGKNIILNCTLKAAQENWKLLKIENGRLLKIYLTAPLTDRKQRILKRTPNLTFSQLEFKLESDPSKDLSVKEFDFVIENHENKLNETVNVIFDIVKNFLGNDEK